MCPTLGNMVNDQGRMVAHCLLIETERDGLVLVDTGIGLEDCATPRQRLSGAFVAVTGLNPDPLQTAARQVETLGFKREDVRHIVVTHLDLDHAGGLPDFPHARVHVHSDEHRAAVVVRAFKERSRYRTCHWAHSPKFELYSETAGDRWFGFEKAKPLAGLSAEIVAIPLPGHTQGHAAIAVRGDRWLLHAGDAFFHEGVVDSAREKPRFGAMAFERLVAFDYSRVKQNHRRLRELHDTHKDEVTVFCAHDPNQFARLRAGSVEPKQARPQPGAAPT
jgi:glyoxylase-like metal-dependent hydrolase (beta-lactamase superfamily II)